MNSLFVFPNGTRKAVTFTIDDGNLPLDKKFIDIVRPAGIKGTFNLMGTERMSNMTPEEYREFYRGFEIANHCGMHPKVITESEKELISDEKFVSSEANTELLYKTDMEGLYYKYYRAWWGYVATPETYIKLVARAKAELESVFGEGNIKAFVWPYCEQNDDAVKAYLAKNYESVRRTGSATFELPKDRMAWCYNATHANLNERAAEFETEDNGGELMFLCFGVHSHDFENNHCWDVLEKFAEKYGNRPHDFWYATVGEIFEYEDAVKSATVTDGEIVNGSGISIYVKVDGKTVEIKPGEVYKR